MVVADLITLIINSIMLIIMTNLMIVSLFKKSSDHVSSLVFPMEDRLMFIDVYTTVTMITSISLYGCPWIRYIYIAMMRGLQTSVENVGTKMAASTTCFIWCTRMVVRSAQQPWDWTGADKMILSSILKSCWGF